MDLKFSNDSSKLDVTASDLKETNTPLVLSLVLSVLVVIFSPPLLFAIIWFERFGSDEKRTILNMLVSMNCWNCIALVTLGQVPEIVIYSAGPLPPVFCYIHAVIRESIIASVLMHIDAIIVFRFIYIFRLKNPAAFRDDFWCLFVSLWIHLVDLISVATLNIWANFQSVPTIICTGQITALPNKAYLDSFIHITVISALLYFTINLRIYFHKKRFKISSTVNQNQFLGNLLIWKNIEAKSLATILTDLLGICIFLAAAVSMQMLSAVKPEYFKVYPNYLILLYLDLLSPCLGIVFAILSFFRKNALRRNLKENLKGIFEQITN